MRVVEPSQFIGNTPSKKKRRISLKLASVGFVAIVFVWVFTARHASSPSIETVNQILTQPAESSDIEVDEENPQSEQSKTPVLRQFTDNEFKVFYDNLLQPNLTRVENPPVISGNDIADARIRKIAEDRGYRLRSSPTVTLSTVDGFAVHSPLVSDWPKLKAEASKAGLSISIVSSYRSVDSQRSLFLERLAATGATIEQVAAGTADDKVNEVLITSSIPGYSKHHTGYTLDIACAGYAFENFKNSPCQTWISADNYKVAKENGFIPSYPPKADVQGPDPEAWEYVWVGTELMYQ